MTGTPTDASSECGHPANELLDFYVNGSLEGDEAAMVHAHVAACALCSRDVRELQSLSESIAAHGVAPVVPGRGRVAWGWIGTAAAAVVAIGAIVYTLRPGAPGTRIASSPAEPGGSPVASDGALAGVEVPLDLGGGSLRGAAGPPRVDLGPDVSIVRLSLFHPEPGTHLRIEVRGPSDEEVLPDMELPPHDSMGRVSIPIPATRFASPGLYRALLTTTTPRPGGPFSYPFEVFRPTHPE